MLIQIFSLDNTSMIIWASANIIVQFKIPSPSKRGGLVDTYTTYGDSDVHIVIVIIEHVARTCLSC